MSDVDHTEDEYVAPPPPVEAAPYDPPEPAAPEPAAPEPPPVVEPDAAARAQELRVASQYRPLTDGEKSELDEIAQAEADAAGHVVAEPPEVVVPEDHPVRHAIALNSILDMLEGVPALSGLMLRIRQIRNALNYVPPKE